MRASCTGGSSFSLLREFLTFGLSEWNSMNACLNAVWVKATARSTNTNRPSRTAISNSGFMFVA